MQTTNHRLNGQAQPTTGTTSKGSGKAKTKQPKRTTKKQGLAAKQRTAILLGSVAAGLVFLSVYHLTCAVGTLTGSPLVLAVLLAIGIDLGLVASEVAEMIADDKAVKGWSKIYMAMATVMSMALNAYEFAAHAPKGLLSQGLSVCFGLALPVMIYVLARQAGGLWAKK